MKESKSARQGRFLEELARHGGHVMRASLACGIGRKQHARWIRTDPAYRSAFERMLTEAAGLDAVEETGQPGELLRCAIGRALAGSRRIRQLLLGSR